MMTGSAGWGDAIVAVPWEQYRTYGDRQVLEENWESMRRWVDWQLGSARTSRHHSREQRSPEPAPHRSEEHTSELQSRGHLVCRLLLEKNNTENSSGLRTDLT